MPLTAKGEEIMESMKETYGSEKGEQVFYASKNAGKISGVDTADTEVGSMPESPKPDMHVPPTKAEGMVPDMGDANPLAPATPATFLEVPEEHSLPEAPQAPHVPIPDSLTDSPLEANLPRELDTGIAGRARWQIWEK